MNERQHSYYPPRARWYSPVCHALPGALRRVNLEWIPRPSASAVGAVLLSLLIPGYAWTAAGHPNVAWVIYAAYALSAAVFILWLGHVGATLAFGTMVSLHVCSVLYLVGRPALRMDLRRRLILSMVAGCVVSLGIYVPLQRRFQEWLAMPLRVGDKVIIVGADRNAGSVRRGAWVAYRIEPVSGDHVVLSGGFALGRVQAVAGDRVVFTPDNVQVNNAVFPRRLYMPVNETWVVPENHWFIWPDSAISIKGNPPPGDGIAQLMRGIALVPEPRYAGKPLRRWFWRRQTLP